MKEGVGVVNDRRELIRSRISVRSTSLEHHVSTSVNKTNITPCD